jgi:hypothetical protein
LEEGVKGQKHGENNSLEWRWIKTDDQMLQNQTALENHDSQNSLPFSSDRNHYG